MWLKHGTLLCILTPAARKGLTTFTSLRPWRETAEVLLPQVLSCVRLGYMNTLKVQILCNPLTHFLQLKLFQSISSTCKFMVFIINSIWKRVKMQRVLIFSSLISIFMKQCGVQGVGWGEIKWWIFLQQRQTDMEGKPQVGLCSKRYD